VLASFVMMAGCSAPAESEDDSGREPAAEQALTIDGFKEPTAGDRTQAMANHANLDPQGLVPPELLANAVALFDLNADRIDNKRYVTVIDFAKHSSKKRFFIVNMTTGQVEAHVVAHGSGSDPEHTGYARRFSNVEGTNASSLGYYLAAEEYVGNHGRSMRLDGVSDTNSNARSRTIVVHGADYVENGRSPQGRSWGCPALPEDEVQAVITKLENGSVLYAERSQSN
jgi:hypothetical protein